jgi:hypothetical protein
VSPSARATLAILLLPAAHGFAQNLEKPPFPDWRDSTVLKLLTDSPWTRSFKVRLQWSDPRDQPISYKDVPGADQSPTRKSGSPIGGIGVPKIKLPLDADLLLRWASALPVRQAAALYKQRDSKLPPAKINELVGVPAAEYVLELRGVPSEIAHSGAESVEAIARQSCRLRTASGRVLKPVSARVNIQGAAMTVFIHFPRSEPIEMAERDVEFIGDFQIFEVRQRFRLSSMSYLGRLEL